MLLRVRRTKTSCAMTLVRTHMTGLWLHGAARVSWALTGKMLPLSPLCTGLPKWTADCKPCKTSVCGRVSGEWGTSCVHCCLCIFLYHMLTVLCRETTQTMFLMNLGCVQTGSTHSIKKQLFMTHDCCKRGCSTVNIYDILISKYYW